MQAVALDGATRERFHPRVEAGFMVKLLIDGKALIAKAQDLSMAGLLITGHTDLRRSKVSVAIPLPDDREVVATCLVRRADDDGLALEFEHLDWEDMFALARFLHPRLP